MNEVDFQLSLFTNEGVILIRLVHAITKMSNTQIICRDY